MKINQKLNNKTVNFKGNVLIQVSKKAFKSPENLKQVGHIFDKACNKASGSGTSRIINDILYLSDKSKIVKSKNKVVSILEQPLYIQILNICKKNQIPSPYWLGNRMGVPIEGALDQNYHSFQLLTKDTKDKYIDALFDKTKKEKMINEIKQKITPTDIKLSLSENIKRQMTELKVYLNESLQNISGKPEQTFKIDDLSELPGIFKKIDY